MTNEIRCTSCNVGVTNSVGSVKFLCPKCSKFEIVRCPKCRKNVARYICKSCGFSGPN